MRACFSSITMVTKTSSERIGVANEVDAVGQQKSQRRLRERIKILRREPAVAHHDRLPVGDDLDRGRRIIFEPDLAGLLDVELALHPGAVGTDLNEFAGKLLNAGQILADLVGLRPLRGIERGGGGGGRGGGGGLGWPV